jgi:hypothetical protein
MSNTAQERYRNEIAEAYKATERVRLAAKVSAAIGFLGVAWTLGALATGAMGISEGLLFLVGTALATVVPAAGLYAASYRTSLGAARMEQSLDAQQPS